jgi:membrane protease YdiL (CAAX protease family)
LATRSSQPERAPSPYLLSLALAVLLLAAVLNNVLARDAYLLTCIVTASVLIVLASRDGLTWTDLGLGAGSLRAGIVWGAAMAGIVLAGYLLVFAVPAARIALVDDRATQLSAAGVLWHAMVRVPLGTVLLEEVAFRGVLWAMIARRRGAGWATAVSSVLFGLWHVLPSLRAVEDNAAAVAVFGSGPLGQGLAVTAAVVGTAIAGMVFCELRRRSGSLLAPAALHWALNGFGYLFSSATAQLGAG